MAILEVCVDRLSALEEAQAAGAARIELCTRLDLDGLSPPPELLAGALERARVPVQVMVRPRAGDFVLRPGELEVALAELARLRESGAAGAVFGPLTPRATLDRDATARLVAAARPLAVTFHRAFDSLADPLAGLDALIDLGVERVLTSGGAPDAYQGRHALRALVRHARGRIAIMAGGGVRAHNALAILRDSGVEELHASVPFVVPALDGPAP